MMYLKGTLYTKRCLRADSLSTIMWCVDGSYRVHWDSKGQTGAAMTMGKGAIINMSRKHKLNVGSSTHAELISISDALGWMMWCKLFLEAQGYSVNNNILFQDNKSTILLAKNGRLSAGRQSKHVENRFFLITDKVARNELQVLHKGTKDMIADIHTKPVQGSDFRYLRSEIMGISVEYDDDVERRQTHPLLLPKLEQVRISRSDSETLEYINVGTTKREQVVDKPVVPKNVKVYLGKLTPKKLPKNVSISSRALPVANRRSVLDNKHYPESGPMWKQDGVRFPGLRKALLEDGLLARRASQVYRDGHRNQ